MKLERNMALSFAKLRKETIATRQSAFAAEKLGRCHKPPVLAWSPTLSAPASTTANIRYDDLVKSDSLVYLFCILD